MLLDLRLEIADVAGDLVTSLLVSSSIFLLSFTASMRGTIMSFAESRLGKVLSICAIRPPMLGSFSTRYTLLPVPAISSAVCIPAMPPPTMSVLGVTGANLVSSGLR